MPRVICLESMWHLLGVPWGQALQGDQNLHWDLGHQQVQRDHDYQQGPIKKKWEGQG